MKVDRAAFLAITGVLAAGCNDARPAIAPTTPAEAARATQPAAPTAAIPPAASAVATAAPIEAAPAPTPSAETPPAGNDDMKLAPLASSTKPSGLARGPIPPPRPNRKSLGLENGCGKGKVAFDPAKQACNDEQGAETDCVEIVSSGVYPTTESGRCPGAAAAQRRCNVYSRYFKPRIAHDAGECLKKATGKACDGCKFFRCGHESLMTACVDHSADYDCGVIDSLCADVSKNRCLSYLSGMNQQGRDAIVECLKKDCTRGFLRCLESVK